MSAGVTVSSPTGPSAMHWLKRVQDSHLALAAEELAVICTEAPPTWP